jgi:hypothetical protein
MDTFVVRVHRSGQDRSPADGCLRGVVEEISSGLQATFRDTTELLSILRRGEAVDPHAPTSTAAGPPREDHQE